MKGVRKETRMKQWKKLAVLAMAGVMCGSGVAHAQTMLEKAEKSVADTAGAHFPVGVPNEANRAYFTGESFVAKLTDGSVPVYNVTFYNGAHTHWHIHHGTTQTLLAVSGVGYYQIWGQPAVQLRPGDSVTIPAEVKHWHGAAPGQTFQHISISEPKDGVTNEWLDLQ